MEPNIRKQHLLCLTFFAFFLHEYFWLQHVLSYLYYLYICTYYLGIYVVDMIDPCILKLEDVVWTNTALYRWKLF